MVLIKVLVSNYNIEPLSFMLGDNSYFEIDSNGKKL